MNIAVPLDTQTTSETTLYASPAPNGISLENLYVFYATLVVAIGILIVADTALVIGRKVLENS